jgi:hypothetical protein
LVNKYDYIRSQKCITVCLVDNKIFTAAAVEYSKEEAIAFAEEDGRPKIWFVIPLIVLSDNSGISSDIIASFS